MNPFISEFNHLINKTIESLKEEVKSIRSGRVNPGLIENIIVETYGGQSKLKLMELSTITTEGANNLIVVPFDSSVIHDIEKAILKSQFGFTPQVQGSKIILRVPFLSQEQREKLIKLVNDKVEEKKTIVRNHRDDIRKKIKTAFEKKELTEDEKFRIEKEIDNMSQTIIQEVQKIKENKEKEIMEI
jgi:ribosome recycling factor